MNKDDIYTDKPPSQIYPEKTPEKVAYTLEEIDKHTADFWKKIDQKYYITYQIYQSFFSYLFRVFFPD